MPKRKFEATQGLLQDDVRKQAGSIEKAFLEAVMNSQDAGASFCHIKVEEHKTTIKDDGSGMTEEEINNYFRKFGFKDDDVEEKTFGKFRRGRGQIFNFGLNVWHTRDNLLVVNLDEDETVIEAPIDKNAADDGVLGWEDGKVCFDTSGLGYNHQKTTEEYDGTKIEVFHYKNIDNLDEKISNLKKLVRYIPWLHGLEVKINGQKIQDDFNFDYETDEAYFQFGQSTSYFADAAVYNLGAYVNDFKITDPNGNRIPISGVIISKEELDLNNARNNIIEGDEVWRSIQNDYYSRAKEELAQRKELKTKEEKWLIKQCGEDPHLLREVKEKPLLEDVQGNSITLSELEGNKFSFAPEGNAIAKEAMERKGVIMIQEDYESAVKSLPKVGNAKEYSDVVEDDFSFEMKERDRNKLTKRRRDNLDKIEWLLREIDCYDNVKAGFSRHEDVWRDDKDNLYIDEDFLNKKKNVFLTKVIDRVIEVAAHDGDTRKSMKKNNQYRRNYYRYMSKVAEPRRKLMNGNWDNVEDRTFH